MFVRRRNRIAPKVRSSPASFTRAIAAGVEALERRQLLSGSVITLENTTVDEGQVTLDLADLATEVDGAVQSWSINWGDGSDPEPVLGSPDVTHAYDGDNTFTITATATTVGVGGPPGMGRDETFGDDENGTASSPAAGDVPSAAMAVVPGGKILVAGVDGTLNRPTLTRYESDGTVDNAFGIDGNGVANPAVNTGFSTFAGLATAIQDLGSDYRIIVAGVYESSGDGFALVGYHSDGSIDTDFGDNGLVQVDVGSGETLTDIAITADNQIVIFGTALVGGDFRMIVARFNEDGTADDGGIDDTTPGSFGSSGRIETNFTGNDIAADMVLDPDGKIVIAGTVGLTGDVSSDFLIARYNADGDLDTTFGDPDGGVLRTGFVRLDAGGEDIAAKLAISNSRIAITGISVVDPDTLASNLATAMLDLNGDLTSFGGSGVALREFASFPPMPNQFAGAALATDGSLLVSGVWAEGTEEEYVFLRYNAAGDTADAQTVPSGGQFPTGGFAVEGSGILISNTGGGMQVSRFTPTVGGGGTTETPVVLEVTIENVAPTANLTAPSGIVLRRETITVTGNFDDVIDTNLTATLDLGDGTSQLVTSGFSVTHAYAQSGNYTVTLSVSDGDDTTVASQTITVDSIRSSGGVLTVSAATNGGAILVGPNNVVIDGQTRNYATPTRIVILGSDASDIVSVAGSVNVLVEIYGGAGNDVLNGGNGGNIIVGGDGIDSIAGGSGRDILIGGRGADAIVSNPGDDILVAGYTEFDSNPAALGTLYNAWNGTGSYSARVTLLRDTGVSGLRLRGGAAGDLNATVFDDSEPDEITIDVLHGASGEDWFLANVSGSGQRDLTPGAKSGEVRTDISAE